jgi:hypothetical protein
MAKRSGLGARLFWNGINISGDVSAVDTIASPRATQDRTGIDKSAYERGYLKADGRIGFSSFFNDGDAANRAAAAGSSFHELSRMVATDVVLAFSVGASLGDACAMLVAQQAKLDVSRPGDGSLAMAAEGQASAGHPLEWGEMITPGQITHASADSSTGLVTAQTTDGGVGYLFYEERDSGTPTFVIEDSADTTDGDDGTWGTLLTFTGTGGASSFGERKTVTGTIEKGLRATTTGTFVNADFAMAFRRGTAEDDVSLA